MEQNQPTILKANLSQQNQQNRTTPQPHQVNKDRVIDVLVKEVERLKKEVDDIRNDKIIEALQLPEEQLEEAGVLKTTHRLNTSSGWRPLLESEIDEAQSQTDNATQAAKYLGVAYRTYKKWCLVYNKWKVNPWGKGMKRKWDPNKGKYPLNQILEGKFPNYPPYRLKDLLIRSGVKEPKCEVCGFHDRRDTDGKMPLLLNFLDGDEHNHHLDNLQMLCYCCFFLQGRGYIRRGKVEFNFLDPDRIQGSSRKIDTRF